MKKLMLISVLFFMTSFFTEKEAANIGVNFGVFYSSLSPYGDWIQIDADLVVWKPYGVASGWAPYTYGHWEYTPDGWYWDSDEVYGWATYHYGRWYYDNYYGWVWVPGYTWAPAWVEWRYNDAYIGWAPLPPFADFSVSVGIHFSINMRSSYHPWCFVPYGHFHDVHVHNYFVPAREKNYVFNNTKYRTNYSYRDGRVVNGGVSRGYIEKKGGQSFTERSINSTSNINDYTKTRSQSGRGIVSYNPSSSDVQKYRDVNTSGVKKSTSGKTSLKRDLVSFGNYGGDSKSNSRTTSAGSTATRGSVTSSGRSSTSAQWNNSATTTKSSSGSSSTSTRSSATTPSRNTYQYNKNNSSSGQSSSSSGSNGSSVNRSGSSSSSPNVIKKNTSSSSSSKSSSSVKRSNTASSSSGQVKKSNSSSSSNKSSTKSSSSSRSSSSNSSKSKTTRSR